MQQSHNKPKFSLSLNAQRWDLIKPPFTFILQNSPPCERSTVNGKPMVNHGDCGSHFSKEE